MTVGGENDQFIIIYRYVVKYSTDLRELFLSLSAVNCIIALFSHFSTIWQMPLFFFNSPFYSPGLKNESLYCSPLFQGSKTVLLCLKPKLDMLTFRFS